VVVGCLAGERIAGAAVVSARLEALRLYPLLALCSLLLAVGWQAASVAVASPQAFAMSFYQRFVSQLDGRSCPSYPVCSSYAHQALDKHGLLLGSWLMLDRLIHEGDDLRSGPRITIGGEARIYDPLSRNDFWLERGEE